jgi:hypothetical protein
MRGGRRWALRYCVSTPRIDARFVARLLAVYFGDQLPHGVSLVKAHIAVLVSDQRATA